MADGNVEYGTIDTKTDVPGHRSNDPDTPATRFWQGTISVKRSSEPHLTLESNRRADALHPGVLVQECFIDPLAIDVGEFARHVGIEAEVLAAILAGHVSLSVWDAVSIGRALQISPERLMRMQVRHDFARARVRDAETPALFRPTTSSSFPSQFERGRLDKTRGRYAIVPYRPVPDANAIAHEVRRGDVLRIYSDEFDRPEPLWHGIVLADLDGDVYFPYVERAVWTQWFVRRLPVDLHVP